MKLIATITCGSKLHGTDTPTSDLDLAKVYLPDVREAVFDRSKVKERHGETDLKEYRLDRLVTLAMAGNPSVLELFYAPYVDHGSATWGLVRTYRGYLLSTELYPRFRGYAIAESHDMTKLNGEMGEKRREEFFKHGYILKKAASVLRLCASGTQLLRSGTMTFPVPDASFLRSIKLGQIELREVEEEITYAIRELDAAYVNSDLPVRMAEEKRRDIEEMIAELIRVA